MKLTRQLPPLSALESVMIDGEPAYLEPFWSEGSAAWCYNLWTAAGRLLAPRTPFIGRPDERAIRDRLTSHRHR